MERRLLITTGAVLAGGMLARPAMAQNDADQSRALAERFASALTAHDMGSFAALFADDYVNHQVSAAAPAPNPGMTMKQGTVAFFAARLAGIPDLEVAIEALVASPGKVAASFVYTGSHGGPLYGVPATGRKLRFTSCDIFGVSGGRFIEHWGMGDIAGTLTQLKS